MPILFKNNATALLAASISTSATTIVISAGLGASFPSPVGGSYFYATLFDSVGNYEIVKVTAKNVDSFTVLRGQDGTSALAFNAGDGFAMRTNAAVFENLVQLDGNQTIAGVKTFSDGINSNVTGNLTGNTTGTHTGPVIGNVTGNVTGNLTGNVTGNVSGNAGTVTTITSGQVTGALGYTPYNAASISGASVNYANSAGNANTVTNGVYNNGGTYSINISGVSAATGCVYNSGPNEQYIGLSGYFPTGAWNVPTNYAMTGMITENAGEAGSYWFVRSYSFRSR